jgi:hypothetical protein
MPRLDQGDLLATRLMFCALAIGENLTAEADMQVRAAFAGRIAVDHIAWVDDIRVGHIVDGGLSGRLPIMGLKFCP